MDPTRLREWVTIHRKLGKSPEPPLELGDELDQTLCLRGVNFKVHWTVREADRPRRAVWEGKGPARSSRVPCMKCMPTATGPGSITATSSPPRAVRSVPRQAGLSWVEARSVRRMRRCSA